MPELPEVETTRQGIARHILNQRICRVQVNNYQLRYSVPQDLAQQLNNQYVEDIKRRGKYLLFKFADFTLLVHLGMSGSLRIEKEATPARKHDHIILHFANQSKLCYHDPRRFGAVLLTTENPLQHQLLRNLGVEPLGSDFNGAYLLAKSARRRIAVKPFIMDAKVVVGVGNIYASEALFMAKINPQLAANKLNLPQAQLLVTAIVEVLKRAIEQGGTTLRDFVNTDGNPGYFAQQLMVYNRQHQKCLKCEATIEKIVQAQRASYFCPHCQR